MAPCFAKTTTVMQEIAKKRGQVVQDIAYNTNVVNVASEKRTARTFVVLTTVVLAVARRTNI